MVHPDDLVNWDKFEELMIKQFPFLPKRFTRGEFAADASWVSEFVQNNLSRFINEAVSPGVFDPSAKGLLRYELLETNRSLILRLKLPKGMSPRDVKTSIGRRNVKLALPSGRTQRIPLGKPVNSKRARADFRSGVLEIRMPKLPEREEYNDLYL